MSTACSSASSSRASGSAEDPVVTGFAAILGRYGRTRRKDAGCRTDGRSVSWAGVGRRKRQIEWPLVALRGEGAQMREWRERGGSQSEGKGEKGGTTRRRERRDRRQGVGPRVRTDAGGSEDRTGGLSLERVPPIVLGAVHGQVCERRRHRAVRRSRWTRKRGGPRALVARTVVAE